MTLIGQLRSAIKMEVRANSQGDEYLEAVIGQNDLELLRALLQRHLGSEATEPGRTTDLPPEVEGLVESLGGLRIGQSFFYRSLDTGRVAYAALWPWESNPGRITIKAGVATLLPT